MIPRNNPTTKILHLISAAKFAFAIIDEMRENMRLNAGEIAGAIARDSVQYNQFLYMAQLVGKIEPEEIPIRGELERLEEYYRVATPKNEQSRYSMRLARSRGRVKRQDIQDEMDLRAMEMYGEKINDELEEIEKPKEIATIDTIDTIFAPALNNPGITTDQMCAEILNRWKTHMNYIDESGISAVITALGNSDIEFQKALFQRALDEGKIHNSPAPYTGCYTLPNQPRRLSLAKKAQ